MNLLDSWPQMASTGEAVLFCCTALIMILGALGVLFFKKAAYAAISMVAVMLGLAVLYVAQSAPFLGIVQVVVYTGAIMMLFLFVIMMIGIGTTDDYTSQSRGAILAAVLAGLGFALVFLVPLARTTLGEAKGLAPENPYSDEPITSLATKLFSEHWLTMEVAGALLITAAIGAMLLTHTDRLGPKISQKETANAKMRAFAQTGRRIGQLPAPGVYAKSDAADVPAISGETLAPIAESVPRVIRVRGLDRPIDLVDPEVAKALTLARNSDVIDSPFAPDTRGAVTPSGAWGMPGPGAPEGLDQPRARTAPAAEETLAITQEEEK